MPPNPRLIDQLHVRLVNQGRGLKRVVVALERKMALGQTTELFIDEWQKCVLLDGSYTNALTLNNAGNQFTGAFAGSGAGLTGLNASNISSGNLNIARMPTGGDWNLSSNLNIGTGVMFLDNTNNRVGIGTSAPSSRLHVNSDVGEFPFRAQIAGVNKLLVAPTGGVSIGASLATPPENGLYVAGRTGIGVA